MPIRLLLIDDDPIFRLGLRTALEDFSDLKVATQANSGTEALDILMRLQPNTVSVIILEPVSGRSNINPLSGLPLCQRLKGDYPELPVLLLTSQSEPLFLRAAQQFGIEGYCPKGVAIADLVQAIRQLAIGQSDWQRLPDLPPTPINSVRPPSWHHQVRSYGLQQIEESLALVTQELQKPNLSNFDWLFWSGRRRELLAARWLVNQLLPTDVIVVEDSGHSERLPAGVGRSSKPRIEPIPSRAGGRSPALPSRSAIALSPPASLSAKVQSPSPNPQAETVQPATPFELTLSMLQSDLPNLSGVPLEIDILVTEKKRDLLYIVLRKLQEILEELRFSQVTLEQLPPKRSQILLDLWQASITDFFGKYYTLPLGNQNLEIVNVLLGYAVIVQASTLDKIPLVVEFLSQQLFETPLLIDNVSYSARTPEALVQAEMLLQNLIIQVANAVMQPLLNEFADLEAIKQNFYAQHLISSREVARFRNNLSWKYRLAQWIEEPKAIFESRYPLFVLSDAGIKQTSIYAPRRQELEQLQGIPLAVTLAFESRDAIAPRLRSTVAWAGKGVVYILTQVIGRSIGLVVRGVIQGIGNTLQDARFGKNSERGK
ncbi:response regulator containing a CheY-like receiver domain and an HTH DNA-binding domain [Allocoleopsis franciscana PCC 7113]|uniref:Response regulator containing a CheY-like receiver domain and an HTH DNA-binding domain n=2 Tax=Allocoleopsis TaxID=2886347 RepID=K9W8V3_9CYAN|nr:response regulator containing a CheY-like receiver domain and an HTH DNA-binding domain [Allocoleopsis franciscana PCC 7113]